jgi:hypothetical protein
VISNGSLGRVGFVGPAIRFHVASVVADTANDIEAALRVLFLMMQGGFFVPRDVVRL